MKEEKKKRGIGLVIVIAISILFATISQVLGMQHYQKLDFVTGLVTATSLNVRQGPGTKYNVITQINKNEYIRVFAKIGDWYVIQTDKDFIGAVSSKYVKPIYPSNNQNNSNSNKNEQNSDKNITSELTIDEQEVYEKINAERIKAGLSALMIDDEVQNVARIKAKDMITNNYFAHESPTYGTPFEMLKKYGVSYKTAGENIAGHSSNAGAVEAWMNSQGHKENILNSAYNYTGIAVVNSPKYGKLYVQMFIGK